jgi:hypothetical protein
MIAPEIIHQLVKRFDQHREIKSTDWAIGRFVYELFPTGMIYGLSEEEIGIVEQR